MRWMKWVGAGAALLLITACFFTWIVVPSKNIVVSGVDATGTSFGRPGYFHLLFSFFFSSFFFYSEDLGQANQFVSDGTKPCLGDEKLFHHFSLSRG